MIDYTIILNRKYNAEWILNGDDYEGLVWLSDSPKPSKEELDGQWDSVKAEIDLEIQTKKAKRQVLLDKLGITEDEARLLLGGN